MAPQSLIAIPVLLLLMIIVVWVFFLGGAGTVICEWFSMDYLAACS